MRYSQREAYKRKKGFALSSQALKLPQPGWQRACRKGATLDWEAEDPGSLSALGLGRSLPLSCLHFLLNELCLSSALPVVYTLVLLEAWPPPKEPSPGL